MSSNWVQQGGKLVGTGNSGDAGQGGAVAVSADGNTILIGGAKDNQRLGAVNATTNNGTYQGNILSFKTTLAPSISSFTPTTAATGTTVTINGSNLNGATVVTFNGVSAASFTIVSPTVITAVVGTGATGYVSVVTPLGNSFFNGFSYVPVPTITASVTTITPGGSALLTAIPGTGFSYQWLLNGVNISGATSSSYTATQVGSYTVSITLNGVSQTSLATVISNIFTLPSTNFTITTVGATCKGSNNGIIKVSAAQHLNYTATITGAGLNAPYTFTDSTSIPNLAAGMYNVCITIAGQSTYQQCFSVIITEPKDLSAYVATVNTGNQVVLTLGGGASYNINLNGVVTTTTSSSVTLNLAKGANTILISTDKACQGVIEKEITVSDEVLVYPNPFDDVLNLALGKGLVLTAVVKVYGVDGKQVYSGSYSNVSGAIRLDLSSLKSGLYVLRLSADGVDTVFKVVKR